MSEGDVQNHIGGLSSHPGKGFQRVPVVGNLAAVPVDELLRQQDHVSGLAAKQSDGLDRVPDRIFAKCHHLLRGIGNGEQWLGGLVHALVRRLRGKHDGNE